MKGMRPCRESHIAVTEQVFYKYTNFKSRIPTTHFDSIESKQVENNLN